MKREGGFAVFVWALADAAWFSCRVSKSWDAECRRLDSRCRPEEQSGAKVPGGCFEECEVVGFACARRHAHNLLFHRVDHDLSFLGMALFLAGIAALLFFWGRSMRCSLASTTITVRSKEPSCNAFLPGR